MHRSKRPIEPESCFGNIKFNHCFKRFHLKPTRKTKVEWGLMLLAHNLRKYVDHKAKIREKYAQSMIMVVEKTLRRPLDSCRKALTERGRPRPRERLPKERSSEGWMKRSGTLAEPSDNTLSQYIMQETDTFGSASCQKHSLRMLTMLSVLPIV